MRGPLFHLWLHSLKRRLITDLGQNVVLIICTAVVFSLFLYIFSDFLTTKITTLSWAVQSQAMQWFLGAWSTLSCWGLLHSIHLENIHPHGTYTHGGGLPIGAFALREGSSPATVRTYRLLRATTLFAILTLLSWGLICVLFTNLPPSWHLLHLALCVAGSLLGLWMPKKSYRIQLSPLQLLQRPLARSAPWVWRIVWKATHIWYFYPPSRNLALCAYALVISLIWISHPLHILGICALAGNLMAWAICTQEAEALRCGTYEKLSGTSHRQHMLSLWMACMMAALSLWILAGGVMALRSILIMDAVRPDLTLHFTTITTIAVLIIPCVIFTIDARKASLTGLIVTLCFLFVATAVLAEIRLILAMPLVAFFSYTSQKEGYYKA